jgi:hypothetical protein
MASRFLDPIQVLILLLLPFKEEEEPVMVKVKEFHQEKDGQVAL